MNGVTVAPCVRLLRPPSPAACALMAAGALATISPALAQISSPNDSPMMAQGYNPNSSLAAPLNQPDAFSNLDGFSGRYASTPRYVRRIPIFFPPTPPALGAPLPGPAPASGPFAAPAELAAYVDEPFYPQLSTQLAEDGLKGRLRTRLDAYRAARLALLGELRTRLNSLADADPSARERELAAFARTQTPRLVELEAEAERLRQDLIGSGIFNDSTNWNDFRSWELGVSGFRNSSEAILAQYQVMRAAVFYQKGLSPAQRRLLREVTMDLADVVGRLMENDGAAAPVASADTNPLFFFSPETSRVRLPLELPTDLARRISDYEREKAELKGELREAIYHEDSAHFDFLRTRTLEKLAEKEQSRFDALETQAEEIRRELDGLPHFAQIPPLPVLPPAIADRMTTLFHQKRDAQKEAIALVQQIKKIISVSRVEVTKSPEGRARLSIMISPADRTEEKIKPVRDLVARYNEQNLSRIATLEQETIDLRGEVVRFVNTGPDIDDPDKTARELMDESYNAIERRDEWALYKDYRAAILQPGLSPEQRRLLYDGGLETLDLPLPGADRPVSSQRENRMER